MKEYATALHRALKDLHAALKRHQFAVLDLEQAKDKVTFKQDWEEREAWKNLQDCRADLDELLFDFEQFIEDETK